MRCDCCPGRVRAAVCQVTLHSASCWTHCWPHQCDTRLPAAARPKMQHAATPSCKIVPAVQADMIGAEFSDPQSTSRQPLHEELYTKLITAGIYSSHGRDHMISTVCPL